MKNLNIGLIGYGFMGRTHSNAFLQAPRFFDLPWRPVLKAVAARKEPSTLRNRIAPLFDSQCTPFAEFTWMAPPEFCALTKPVAWSTSMTPPAVRANTAAEDFPILMLPAPVETWMAPSTSRT